MMIDRLYKARIALPNAHFFVDDVRFENELHSLLRMNRFFKQINVKYIIASEKTRMRRLGMKEYKDVIINHPSELSVNDLASIASHYANNVKNISFDMILNDDDPEVLNSLDK